jgi:hypothetical protein
MICRHALLSITTHTAGAGAVRSHIVLTGLMLSPRRNQFVMEKLKANVS